MAWTAPGTFVAGTVGTAAVMNTQLRDNMLYLKGQAGAVSIENALMIGSASAPSYRAQVTVADATATRTGAIGAELGMENTSTGGVRYSGIRFRAADTGATVRSASRVLGSYAAGTFNDSQLILQTSDGVETFRDVITLRGSSTGIGTSAPQGALHVIGQTPAFAAQGGMMLLEAPAVNGTLQTLTAAGTVTRAAGFFVIDRNSNGGSIVQPAPFGVNLGASNNTSVVNFDTITVAVTAGGAITVQRTATGGTSGNHDMSLFVWYL